MNQSSSRRAKRALTHPMTPFSCPVITQLLSISHSSYWRAPPFFCCTFLFYARKTTLMKKWSGTCSRRYPVSKSRTWRRRLTLLRLKGLIRRRTKSGWKISSQNHDERLCVCQKKLVFLEFKPMFCIFDIFICSCWPLSRKTAEGINQVKPMLKEFVCLPWNWIFLSLKWSFAFCTFLLTINYCVVNCIKFKTLNWTFRLLWKIEQVVKYCRTWNFHMHFIFVDGINSQKFIPTHFFHHFNLIYLWLIQCKNVYTSKLIFWWIKNLIFYSIYFETILQIKRLMVKFWLKEI